MKHIGISFGRVPTWHDGLGEFSQQLGQRLAAKALALRELGLQLHFHLPKRWFGRFGDDVQYLPAQSWQRIVHPTRQRFDLWHSLHQHIRLKPPLSVRHGVLTVHDLNFLYFKRASRIGHYLRLTQRAVDRHDVVVCISRYVAGDVSRHLRLREAPQVIYNGVSDLSQGPRRAPATPLPSPFLLHLSRMAASKNPAALLALAQGMPQQAFVYAGPGGVDMESMRRKVSEAGLSNVTLLQDVSHEEKAWLFANCAGFVFPSLTEGFGLPPVEAMHFGKPVFLSRLTSLPEVGGDVASYFDSFEPEAMCKVVSQGLANAQQDPELAARLKAQAQTFQWDRCVQQYLALYLRLLDLPPPG